MVYKLRLNNFRNYEALELELGQGSAVFYGKNGAGKTNLLESVFYLASLRSFRTVRERDLLRYGCDSFAVWARVRRRASWVDLRVCYHGPRRKEAFVGESKARSAGDFIGRLAVVAFSPEDLDMIKGSPAVRRRFLDIGLAQSSPVYLADLARYSKTLAQRNALLVKAGLPAAKNPGLAGLLDAWDDQLAEYGASIARYRGWWLARLSDLSARFHSIISDGKETLSLQYRPSVEGSDAADPASGKAALLEALAVRREKDFAVGATSAGPHRDDFAFVVDGVDARSFASQGQQRTAVLAAKIGQLHLMRQNIGDWPVLLLDDVASELDTLRRNSILAVVPPEVQVIATTTELDRLAAAHGSEWRRFLVDGGRVVKGG